MTEPTTLAPAIIARVAADLALAPQQVQRTLALFDDGAASARMSQWRDAPLTYSIIPRLDIAQ